MAEHSGAAAGLLIGVPRERATGERRVAASPDSVKRLITKLGFRVQIEAGAGVEAGFTDAAYAAAGAGIVDLAAVWGQSDLVLKVNPPLLDPAAGVDELAGARRGLTLVCPVQPAQNKALVERMAALGLTVLALDCVPRITRAQKSDVLSSMANIAGYRAVIEAAHRFGGFFGGQMTAAGKSPPAKVLVIGAGVAGLAAIGAARSLGAVVRAFDVRPSVREQINSMGAEFLTVELDESGEGAGGYAKTMSPAFIAAEMALFRAQAKEVDVVITTALIPGQPAPELWTADMVESMKPGSVVVDLAAAQGGNCKLTVPGAVTEVHGVHLIGYTDLTSRLPTISSRFFANNIVNLLEDMGGATKWRVNLDDEVVRGCIVLHEGALLWPPPRPPAPPTPAAAPRAQAPAQAPVHAHPPTGQSRWGPVVALALGAAALGLSFVAPAGFVQQLTVFTLSCVVGWQVIWSVNHALHTPLMSVTNAISGIIIVGGVLQAGAEPTSLAGVLGAVAVLIASVNIAGGFLVTSRMLQMFRKRS
jgi:NAD(P) transhydrogenase subunit alpha